MTEWLPTDELAARFGVNSFELLDALAKLGLAAGPRPTPLADSHGFSSSGLNDFGRMQPLWHPDVCRLLQGVGLMLLPVMSSFGQSSLFDEPEEAGGPGPFGPGEFEFQSIELEGLGTGTSVGCDLPGYAEPELSGALNACPEWLEEKLLLEELDRPEDREEREELGEREQRERRGEQEKRQKPLDGEGISNVGKPERTREQLVTPENTGEHVNPDNAGKPVGKIRPGFDRIIATDGACSGNPGPGGWAWVEQKSGARESGGAARTTNNIMELTALIKGLEYVGPEPSLLIRCDSKYVIDAMTKWAPGWRRKGWKKADGQPVKNRELVERLLNLYEGRGGNTEVEWVKGHAGDAVNELCDSLAVAESRKFAR